MSLSLNNFGAEAMLPLMWLIFKTRPGGAGLGPGVPGVETLTMLPAVANSPLIPASDCTRNAPVTMTLELLFSEVPVVMLELVVEVVLELEDVEELDVLLVVGLVLAVTPELEFALANAVRDDVGSTRRLICVLGPTELRFRLAIPESTLIVPPAIRLKLGRLIVRRRLAPMPLRLVTALFV